MMGSKISKLAVREMRQDQNWGLFRARKTLIGPSGKPATIVGEYYIGWGRKPHSDTCGPYMFINEQGAGHFTTDEWVQEFELVNVEEWR